MAHDKIPIKSSMLINKERTRCEMACINLQYKTPPYVGGLTCSKPK